MPSLDDTHKCIYLHTQTPCVAGFLSLERLSSIPVALASPAVSSWTIGPVCFTFVLVWALYIHTVVCVWRSDGILRGVLSFCHMGPQGSTSGFWAWLAASLQAESSCQPLIGNLEQTGKGHLLSPMGKCVVHLFVHSKMSDSTLV